MGDEEELPEPKKMVLIQACSGYIGGNLAKRFAKEGYEVLGTLKAPSDPKPLAVTTVVEPTAAALTAAFREAEITVLDCLADCEAAEAMLSAIAASTEPIESAKVLIGVSSVMTWSRTSANPDEPETPLTEAEYKRRRPHSSYKDLVALEKLVTKAAREGLRTHVVAAGLTYGADEDLFHPLFKAAWSCQPLPLLTMSDGANVLPTIHIADLCSVVLKLYEADALPYLLALDTPADEEKPQTLAAVVQALSSELGVGEVLEPAPRDKVLLEQDSEFFQVCAPIGDAPPLKLAAAAVNDLGIEWHAQSGLLANIPMVVHEYREARGLQPLRLLVHGNDDLAKSELASALATEYKLPYIEVNAAVEAAKSAEGELAAELSAAGGAVPDELLAKVLAASLTSTTCKNQGYILQGFPNTLAQATMLFGGGGAAAEEGEEAPPPEEGEEGDGASKSALAAPAEYVITLEASEETITAKLKAMAEPPMTEEKLSEVLAAYSENNADDSPTSILALPSLAEVEPLGPLAVSDSTSVDALLTKSRVYLGQPRNYGPSDEEIAAKKALEEAEAAAAAAEEARLAAEREREEAEERKRREEHESRRAAEVQQQENELLEVRSIPLRNYLMANVIPTLTEGLIEVCKLKPEDPVDYLAEYLFKNNPVEEGPA